MTDHKEERTAITSVVELARVGEAAFHLVMLRGPTRGKAFKLHRGKTSIGRGKSCDIVLDGIDISRRHTEIQFNDLVIAKDLKSTNGTYVNGKKIDTAPIANGDLIQLGSQIVFKLTSQDDLEAEVQDDLYQSSILDPLTLIYNRRHFMSRLEAEFHFSIRHQTDLSLIMFDIDFFKRINDRFGHAAGDMVLRGLADRLSSAIRREDIFCRWGGEEFAILLRNLKLVEARQQAERLREMVESTTFTWENQRLPVTISLGAASMSISKPKTPHELVAIADARLYAAKTSGRNRVIDEEDA